MRDRASGTLNVKVERYVKPRFTVDTSWNYASYRAFRYQDALRAMYRTHRGETRYVKIGAWYAVDPKRRDGEWAAAWVRLTQEDPRTGEPRVVADIDRVIALVQRLDNEAGVNVIPLAQHEATSSGW